MRLPSWLRPLRHRKVKELAKFARGLLAEDLEGTVDRNFEIAINSAARALGVEVDATELRLTIATLRQERTHQMLVKEQARHEARMREIKGQR